MLVLVLLAVVADIAIRLSVLAIPLKFIMKNPDCANKLNEAANLTNISWNIGNTKTQPVYTANQIASFINLSELPLCNPHKGIYTNLQAVPRDIWACPRNFVHERNRCKLSHHEAGPHTDENYGLAKGQPMIEVVIFLLY